MKGDELDTAEIHLSDHAVERYIERIRPAADEPCARADIRKLIDFGTYVDETPEWVRDPRHEPDGYFVCGNVAFPVAQAWNGLVVTTTLHVPPRAPIPWPKHARPPSRAGGRAHARDRRRKIREAKAAA